MRAPGLPGGLSLIDAIVRTAWLEPLNHRKLTKAINEAVRLIGYPRYTVKMRAQRLGLTYDKRHRWTKWEEQFLAEKAGTMSVKRMQRRLGHGWTKIEAKIRSMGLRTALLDGMTALDVTLALGVSHQSVQRWEVNGWLRRSSSNDRFREEAVRALIEQHPKEYDLRRVDQDWFKALLFPNAQCFYRPAHFERSPRQRKAA